MSLKPDKLLRPRNPLVDEDYFSEKLRDSEKYHGLIRPLKNVIFHKDCEGITKIDTNLAIIVAKRPRAIVALRCMKCGFRDTKEFLWDSTNDPVGL